MPLLVKPNCTPEYNLSFKGIGLELNMSFDLLQKNAIEFCKNHSTFHKEHCRMMYYAGWYSDLVPKQVIKNANEYCKKHLLLSEDCHSIYYMGWYIGSIEGKDKKSCSEIQMGLATTYMESNLEAANDY